MADETHYTFARDFETNRPLPLPVGRLHINGYTIRIFLGPTGIILTIPEALKSHPNICWYVDDPTLEGIAGV